MTEVCQFRRFCKDFRQAFPVLLQLRMSRKRFPEIWRLPVEGPWHFGFDLVASVVRVNPCYNAVQRIFEERPRGREHA